MTDPTPRLTPYLLFVQEQSGRTEEAVRFYTSIFPNSKIISLEDSRSEGSRDAQPLKNARFTIDGEEVRAFDGGRMHAFGFTPAISLWYECRDEIQQSALFAALLRGGKELMPLSNYGFSQRYGWVQDKYGVTWQLNLA
jgi:predicted 3-demethylubiquinone-9 3-methyltransferase (glyoxalase superfamily)